MEEDFRGFLKEMEETKEGGFFRITPEVDTRFEVSAIVTKLEQARQLPLLFFEKVKGHTMPVVVNCYADRLIVRSEAFSRSGSLPWIKNEGGKDFSEVTRQKARLEASLYSSLNESGKHHVVVGADRSGVLISGAGKGYHIF